MNHRHSISSCHNSDHICLHKLLLQPPQMLQQLENSKPSLLISTKIVHYQQLSLLAWEGISVLDMTYNSSLWQTTLLKCETPTDWIKDPWAQHICI